ncbi:S8 family peptidase [Guptibacillus hwajinpoensis]|uniref:Subtilisin n=1 Tax=Guptibacillus hwajinpoensis TaxID=208199 RepID=A0ABU0JZE6_9BACL|nr:S8 family peptidase [Alkalihalobacillus hemicentroti]MDQ0482478.1 subtilisin [Alkalihalobacillus hemicentroti]
MKKTLTFLVILFIVSLNPFSEINVQAQDKEVYLIGFVNEIKHNLILEENVEILKEFENLSMVKASLSPKSVSILNKSNDIIFIEKDVEVQGQNLSLPSSIQKSPWGVNKIKADKVHEVLDKRGDGVKIAVLDTGIDIDHEDLNVYGGTTVLEEGFSYDDDNGHGTHVAGIISALDNEIGVVGVAPNSQLYAVKVLDRFANGSYSNIIEGINWAVDNGMDIVTMSLGGETPSKSLKKAMKYAEKKGLILIASAGNNGDVGGKDGSITFPAKFKEVISVGASDIDNSLSPYSSTGKELDFVAPGVDILSTFNNGSYIEYSGTSMAAPHVTGTIALMLQKNQNIIQKDAVKILQENSIYLGDSFYFGNGLINSFDSLSN